MSEFFLSQRIDSIERERLVDLATILGLVMSKAGVSCEDVRRHRANATEKVDALLMLSGPEPERRLERLVALLSEGQATSKRKQPQPAPVTPRPSVPQG